MAAEEGAQNQLIVGNTIDGANASIGLQQTDDSVVTFNTISNSSDVGVALQCSSNNWITFNQITDVPADIDAVGMYLSGCNVSPSSNDNHIIRNTISGFCSGVLTGSSANVGTTIAANSFANIGPGANIMAGSNCP